MDELPTSNLSPFEIKDLWKRLRITTPQLRGLTKFINEISFERFLHEYIFDTSPNIEEIIESSYQIPSILYLHLIYRTGHFDTDEIYIISLNKDIITDCLLISDGSYDEKIGPDMYGDRIIYRNTEFIKIDNLKKFFDNFTLDKYYRSKGYLKTKYLDVDIITLSNIFDNRMIYLNYDPQLIKDIKLKPLKNLLINQFNHITSSSIIEIYGFYKEYLYLARYLGFDIDEIKLIEYEFNETETDFDFLDNNVEEQVLSIVNEIGYLLIIISNKLGFPLERDDLIDDSFDNSSDYEDNTEDNNENNNNYN